MLARIAGAAALTMLVAGCDIFSGGAGPSGTPSGAGTTISTTTALASPTPQVVKVITLVAEMGESSDWTPAGLTWTGIQEAAALIGAEANLKEALSFADLAGAVEEAAKADGAVVVTVGPDSNYAVQAAAAAHPATQFLEVDTAVPDSSPANVHGLVFDEAEAGYLGGYVAASFAGKIGMVGDAPTDTRSANYAAGFRSGATQARSGVSVSFGYAANAADPRTARDAAAALVKAGSTVIMAMSSLSGIAALREACAHDAHLIATETDAWETVPDVRPCLIVTVMKRYDTAVSAAISKLGARAAVAAVVMNDVASGGIALSEFHTTLPEGFQAALNGVLEQLRQNPPRATAPPVTPSPVPTPSGSSSP